MLSKKKIFIYVVISSVTLVCNTYADDVANSNLKLYACVYLPSFDKTTEFTFEHVSNYCMISPGRNQGDSDNVKVSASHVGMNCSTSPLNAAYEWNDRPDISGEGYCYSTISYSSFLFSSDTAYNAGGMLYWGGYSSKGLRGNQVFFDGDSNLFQICTMAGICNRGSGYDNTLYYSKNQAAYLIYTPKGF